MNAWCPVPLSLCVDTLVTIKLVHCHGLLLCSPCLESGVMTRCFTFDAHSSLQGRHSCTMQNNTVLQWGSVGFIRLLFSLAASHILPVADSHGFQLVDVLSVEPGQVRAFQVQQLIRFGEQQPDEGEDTLLLPPANHQVHVQVTGSCALLVCCNV